MAKTNRTCNTCGKRYYYCPSCADDHRPTWMIMFDCEECKRIFQICSSFNYGSISKEDARNELEKIGLDDFENYNDFITTDLKNIFSDEIPEKEEKKEKKSE